MFFIQRFYFPRASKKGKKWPQTSLLQTTEMYSFRSAESGTKCLQGCVSRRWRSLWGFSLSSLQEDAGIPRFVPGGCVSQYVPPRSQGSCSVCLFSLGCLLTRTLSLGFRVHWLIQDHILILPSLTITSQSPLYLNKAAFVCSGY